MDFNLGLGEIDGVNVISPSTNSNVLVITGTAGIILPKGNTAQRINDPASIRFNTDSNLVETFTGTSWEQVPVSTSNATFGNVSATNLTGTLLTPAQPNITSVGTLSSLNIAGNITAGNILAGAYLSGTLTTAAQPNIVSIGNPGIPFTVAGAQGLIIPSGNTAQRAISPVGGTIRYNTDTRALEVYEENDLPPEWFSYVQTDVIQEANIFSGFPNFTEAALSMNTASRTFTISPSAANFEVYVLAKRFLYTTPQSIQIPNTEGWYHIYFDGNGSLQYSITDFTWDGTQIPVSIIYWSTITNAAILVSDQRHGMGMARATYLNFLNSTGPVLVSGLSLTGYTTTGIGSLNSDAEISLTDGIIFDGDREYFITHASIPTIPFQQILNGPAQIPALYAMGTGAILKSHATTFPLIQGNARPQYNQVSGGNYTLVDATEGYYIASFVASTPIMSEPVVFLPSSQQYATLEEAKTNFTWQSLISTFPASSLGVLKYVCPLYILIFQVSNTYTNIPHARLVDFVDISVVPPSGKQVPHNTLSGLMSDDHSQYIHESLNRIITAQHTFNPSTAIAPFVLGANTQGQLVTGLNADFVDGHNANYFQVHNTQLDALSNIAAGGIYTITGTGTSTIRWITSTDNSILVTNPNGVGGNINLEFYLTGVPLTNWFGRITTDNHGSVIGNSVATVTDITTALGYAPVNKAGDTMSGTLNMGNNTVTTTHVPAASNDLINKAYVDGLSFGLIWQPPIELSNLTGNLATPPGANITNDAYIIDAGGNTGIWSGFIAGDVVQYQLGFGWRFIIHATTGTRFGVEWVGNTTPTGFAVGYKNYMVQITGGSPGSFTFSYTAPVANDAAYVHNANAAYYGSSYTYSSSLAEWVAFSSSLNVGAGDGLYYTGQTLNVGSANTSRIVVNVDSIDLGLSGVVAGMYNRMAVDEYGRIALASNITSGDITGTLGYTPQQSNVSLTALAGTTTSGLYTVTAVGTSTTRTIQQPAAGITITNADGVAGNPTLALADDLAAVEGIITNGIAVRTGTSAWTTRELINPSNLGITISNADGVLGNVTFDLTGDLYAIETLPGTGFTSITAANVWATRTFGGQANQISITNGDGIAGNPSIAIASNPIIPGTGAMTLPIGTIATLPVGSIGMMRYCSDHIKFEAYNGSWSNVALEPWVIAGYQPLNATLTSLASTGNIAGTAGTALRLYTPRIIGMTGGDASWFVTFDGSVNANAALTFNTVNTNVGQFAVGTFNAKGLATSAANLVMTGDASGTSSGANIVATLATVNANVGTFGGNVQIPQFTVNGKGLITSATNIPGAQFFTGNTPATSGTTIIALTTTPASTDGTQLWSQTVTPRSVGSKFIFEQSFYFDAGQNGRTVSFALFRNSTCIYAIPGYVTTSGKVSTITVTAADSPATTSAVTYSLRVGIDAAQTWYLNQDKAATVTFGGTVNASAWYIREIS